MRFVMLLFVVLFLSACVIVPADRVIVMGPDSPIFPTATAEPTATHTATPVPPPVNCQLPISPDESLVKTNVMTVDDWIGTGFIMWSQRPLRDRFGDMPEMHGDHFVMIVELPAGQGEWGYDRNNAVIPFEAEPGDRILAQITANIDGSKSIAYLDETGIEFNEVEIGYIDSDIVIHPDQIFKDDERRLGPNDGEYAIEVSYVLVPCI